MVNELQTAFNEIAEMRALPPEVVLEALQSALVSAYRRDSSASSAQRIEARIDPATGRARIFVEKEVTEEIFSENTEVTLEKDRFYEPEAQLGDTVMVQVEHTTKQFGRIAAQTAKQVILQKIREAERNALFDEFIEREGDLSIGTVQSINSTMVTLRIGERAEAILPRAQQIPGERYRQHEKLRVYIMEVSRTSKGPKIVCSRSHRNMLRRLLEYEVPEISNGQVEIKSIAREAGYRSKVAVSALQDGIDPVGACVGQRGMRIQNIVKELHDEKIDVIEWNNDAETFISKALSPARVTGVYLDEDIYVGRTAIVVVPDDQLSLAIGREGQNARLAAKLTGWRIDIKSVTETVTGALQNLDVPPMDAIARSHAPLIGDIRVILEKKANNKAIMPEDYNIMAKFANLIETRLQRERDEMRKAEREQIAAVRSTLPEPMFDISITVLGLDDDITEALEPLGSVGELMLATLTDERHLEMLLADVEGEPLALIQQALDDLMEADVDFAELLTDTDEEEEFAVDIDDYVVDIDADDSEPELVAEPAAELQTMAPAFDDVAAQDEDEDEEEEILLDAFGGIVKDEPAPELIVAEGEVLVEVEFDEDAEVYTTDIDRVKKSKKKDRRQRRRLVLDEESGEVVAKRRRKSNRKREDWNETDF